MVIRGKSLMLDWLFEGCLESAPVPPPGIFPGVIPSARHERSRCQPGPCGLPVQGAAVTELIITVAVRPPSEVQTPGRRVPVGPQGLSGLRVRRWPRKESHDSVSEYQDVAYRRSRCGCRRSLRESQHPGPAGLAGRHPGGVHGGQGRLAPFDGNPCPGLADGARRRAHDRQRRTGVQ